MTKRKAWSALLLTLLATILVSTVLPQLYFNYDFDGFFNPNEEATVYHKNQKATFGTDNDFILIGIEPETSPFDPAFLKRIETLTNRLELGPFVQRVISPTNVSQAIKLPLVGGIIQRPIYSDERIDSISISTDPGMIRQLFSDSLDAVSLVVITDQRISKQKCDSIANYIFDSVESFDQDRVHIAGRAIGQVVYIKKIQEEFFIFLMISLTLVVILLFAMFRNAAGVIIPMVVVLLSILWTMACVHFLGKGISLLMSMIPPVIFVVGMSDAVHLYARFIEEKTKGESTQEAIAKMLRKTGLATFITSVTTSIGFGTLYFTGIPALQNFGVITAAGVLITFIISIVLLPSLLILAPIPSTTSIVSNKSWDKYILRWFHKMIKYRKPIQVSTILLTLVLAGVGSHIGLNNYLLEDLKPGTRLKDDFDYFDNHFSGVRPFELGIKSQSDKTLLTRESIVDLEKIEKYLEQEYGVNAIQSIVQVSYEINRTNHGGKPEFFQLPEKDYEWQSLLKDINRLKKTGKLDFLINKEGNYARISGRVADLGALTFSEKDKAFNEFIMRDERFQPFEIQLTGTGNLIDKTNQNLIFNLAKGLAIAFILIAILMGVLFKSVKMVLIALIPNLLPILAVASVMTVFGIDLKLSTGIIFTIAFGIAVDDTIHILSRYKLELRGGATPHEALQKAIVHTGKALIITSLILFGGFLSLCFSSFQSTFYIGLLVTITLVFALLFDLTILPALLSQKKASSLSKRNFLSKKMDDGI